MTPETASVKRKWHQWRPTNGAVALFILLGVIFAIAQATAQHQIDQEHNRAEHTVTVLHTTVRRVDKLTQENHALVTSLQAAIVETCREFGNQRAEVQREQLHEEIEASLHPDPATKAAIAALRIPPRLVQRITKNKVAKLEERLANTKLTPCASQYKISPGSGARRRGRAAG